MLDDDEDPGSTSDPGTYSAAAFDFRKHRSHTLTGTDGPNSSNTRIYLHQFNPASDDDIVLLDLHKRNTTQELIQLLLNQLQWPEKHSSMYDIYEVMGTIDGQACKERKLDAHEYPAAVQTLWPKALPTNSDDTAVLTEYRFVIRRKGSQQKGSVAGSHHGSTIDEFLAKFLTQPKDKEYPDLCMLPELTEQTLLDNLRDRFNSGHIYTYIGPILVAVNPFKFFPIYNPKYAKLYQNRRLGSLPPHIFAVADTTYHNMLKLKQNQCIVISGESGSGKTESTNFLLHHLTTLSQKGTAASSLEQTLLCAGPVLEAFGNAVTAQNNNSSRFGKFIQVNYRENGMVAGANVQIYLLEKSRIISQATCERNYHVFYYLLEGATEAERSEFHLMQPNKYHYLNQNDYYKPEGVDEGYEFRRLRHSMELVGFGADSQRRIFGLLSAVLLLGNVQYTKKAGYHSDDTAQIANENVVEQISELLQVKVENLLPALTFRKTVMRNETVISRYKVADVGYKCFVAINTRDAMAKCLYNALFHWIVLRINQALLKKDMGVQKGFYTGILDIFGFEDVGAQWNSFEQFCINYANERLQAYFNQHIFQFEQEEYLAQGIAWTNIEYTDNTECLQLVHSRPYGLFSLIDEESSIAKGTDESLLQKLNDFHKNNEYYEVPQKREPAFIIAHYAGKVKYQINVGYNNFREKNRDLMRQDVVNALKNSKSAFVRELVCSDPVAVFRWAIVRASFRAISAFKTAASDVKKPDGTQNALNSGRAGSVDDAVMHKRRSSESQLNLFLRGELKSENMPSFVDTSVFSTIVEQFKKKTPKPKETERQVKGLAALKTLTAKRPQTFAKKQHSVGAQFQNSLNRLMDTLSNATPYFIRCIKSNNEKIACYFDEDIILRQLRYTGMLETVRIRRAGYSVRISYEQFAHQYRVLLINGRNSTREDLEQFVENHEYVERQNVQFGNTKIFMRDAEKLLLDDQLHRSIMQHILRLQGWFRTVVTRRRYLKTRANMINLQAAIRGMLIRNEIRQRSLAALIIQTWWRSYNMQTSYQQLRHLTVQMQACCRGWLLRQRFREERDGYAVKLGIIRGSNAKLFQIQQFFHAFELPSFNIKLDDGKPHDDDEEVRSDDDIIPEDDLENLEVLHPLKLKHGTTVDSAGTHDDEVSQPEDVIPTTEFSFVLEDEKLKLIGKPVEDASSGNRRRQSLASAPRELEVNVMRRAASTENDMSFSHHSSPSRTPQHSRHSPQQQSASSLVRSMSKKKSGFFRATQHLKAFLNSRKSDSLRDSDDEDATSSFKSCHTSPPSVAKSQGDHSMQAGVSTESSESTVISHTLKLGRIHRNESCAICSKSLGGFFAHAYKCYCCKLCFHKECHSFASKLPCSLPSAARSLSPGSPPPVLMTSRRPWDVTSFMRTAPKSSFSHGVRALAQGSFSLTRTQQQADPQDAVVATMDDLRAFSMFIFQKQTELANKSKKERETMVDAIFKMSLREFHGELISYEAILKDEASGIRYADLITSFEGSLSKVCIKEQVNFPVTLGVNAFRGFLNEFMQQMSKLKAKRKSRVRSLRKKRRKSDVMVVHLSHRFGADIVHVPTFCEVCNQFMWHSEKIFICQGCRISCHKKCHSKMTQTCEKAGAGSGLLEHRVFAVELAALVDEDHPVPLVLESLLLSIELRGLYVEGLYRKSGSLVQVKQMRRLIEAASDSSKLRFDETNVHVLTALVKQIFRECPEPLITYDLYENFLNVSEVDQPVERLRCLYVMIELLPKAHKAVLDRLMYHLARIAHNEQVNRMGAANLATIFAPCLLRRNGSVHAQEQLQDVNRQAICIECLIEEKLRQYRSTMQEIVEMEEATITVTENLRKIDEHVWQQQQQVSEEGEEPTQENKQMQQARQLFVEQLEFLDKEKDRLIEDLPPLAPVASSEEDVTTSSDEATNSARRSRDRRNKTYVYEFDYEYAIDLNNPPMFVTLRHLTKYRVRRNPTQRPPSVRFRRTLLTARKY